MICNRIDGVISGRYTLPAVEREFWKAKYTCRALEALAHERHSTFEEQRDLYISILNLPAWHKATGCFKRTTSPKECPLSFKQFIESKSLMNFYKSLDFRLTHEYVGQDQLRQGLERSVFTPVLPAGVTEASSSIVFEPEQKNVELRVGSGSRTIIPVSRFNTRKVVTDANVTRVTPLQCSYVLVKGKKQWCLRS